MASRTVTAEPETRTDLVKHPKGLYALFATEMWERFSFYSMLALFTLYMQDGKDGFSWTPAQATSLYANYLMFVYASPLVGGWLADKVLGYRKAVMIGGFFFMAGHGLLSVPALWAVYAALACLVIGNGFFKPNVSTMVGNLYPEGSHLKDRAYNIFYMGINIGAFLAPVVMEVVKARWGFHPAFALAAFGMVISVAILWIFKNRVEDPAVIEAKKTGKALPTVGRGGEMEAVSDGKRIGALIVIFLIVIVFWMVFHQNGSTLTYWADDNTDWNVSGTISNAINPFWIVTLTFPLVWFWKWLDNKGKEPSTPTKMAIGMTLTGLSFLILFVGAKLGEGKEVRQDMFATGSFRISERSLDSLRASGVPQDVLDKITTAKDPEGKFIVLDRKFTKNEKGSGEQNIVAALERILPADVVAGHKTALLTHGYLFLVSPFWLVLAYAVISLGELMLSPMGLSLVSKVAPLRVRGLMMGGWFVATAIGNKLTAIGVYWSIWKQSSFFIILGSMALVMAVVLSLLLKPLKKAMPGV
ncbi:MAG TPA: peptide MFS transporter [Blastocatellia bacterium]|jgi:POT family proton-dependent oligopeptide transporter|nr:peptide MFS transporter [Blastocatellia bacterium]